MGKGDTSPTELMEYMPRDLLEAYQETTPPESGVPLARTQLRVVRFADYLSEDNMPWHGYLAEIGHENHTKGKAYAIGSVAITLVQATEIDAMLQEKYPRDYQTAKTARRVQVKLAKGITSLIRQQGQRAYDDRTENVQLGAECVDTDSSVIQLREDYELDDTGTWRDSGELTLAERTYLQRHQFGDSTFGAKRLDIFGRRWGVDLSAEEQLYEERQTILRDLRKHEGLNISNVDSHWKPHACLFEISDHLRVTSLKEGRHFARPSLISFDRPQPEIG